MAASIQRLGFIALRQTCKISVRGKPHRSPNPSRPFHSSPISQARKADAAQDIEDPSRHEKPQREPFIWRLDDLGDDERAFYNAASPEEQITMRHEAEQMHDYMTSPDFESKMQGAASQAAYELQEELPHVNIQIPRQKPGLLSMGEADEQDSGEDGEFEGDDITSLGHGELEQHREMREYARIAAWEMPLLHNLAEPFRPPSEDEPLRFRYTTYMGENHPGDKKIVMQFCTRDLPGLTEAQRIKLIKLVGVRYNPENDVVKMSSDMFETAAQNKRYLGDLVDTLMAEAKDEKDMFEDIPLDFRHHKRKPQFVFPESWKLNESRQKQLEVDREKTAQEARSRESMGMVIDGSKIIQHAMAAMPARDESRILVEAQQGKGGKSGKGGKGRQLQKLR